MGQSDTDSREDRTSKPLVDRHPPISILLKRFSLHIDALRDMLDEIIPELREMDQRSLHPDVLFAVAELSQERQAEFWEYVREQFNDAVQDHPTLKPADEIGFIPDTPPDGDGAGATVEIPLELRRLEEILGNSDREYISRFRRLIVRATAGPQRVTILHNSLLTMGIGAFEVLVAGLLTRHYVLHPDAIQGDEKVFSLEELAQFEDIDDAADHLIAKKVTKLMYGSVEDWADWYCKNLKTDFAGLSSDFDTVIEAFLRRHIVVHNGGLASRQYLASLPGGFDRPDLGVRLEIDREYLHRVLDQLDELGTALAITSWADWVPGERDNSAGTLLDRTYELMLRGRWSPAVHLTEMGARFSAGQAIIAGIQCNNWHCRCVVNGPESIREEVLSWDTSAMRPLYSMVRLVLLGEIDDAVAMVPDLLRQEEVTRGELKGWPILASIREHPEFEKALTDAEIGILGSGNVESPPQQLSPPDAR